MRKLYVPIMMDPEHSTEIYNEDFKKQEYLEIYPYVEYAKVMGTNKDEFWIYDGPNKYVTLSGWLNGTSPYVHK